VRNRLQPWKVNDTANTKAESRDYQVVGLGKKSASIEWTKLFSSPTGKASNQTTLSFFNFTAKPSISSSASSTNYSWTGTGHSRNNSFLTSATGWKNASATSKSDLSANLLPGKNSSKMISSVPIKNDTKAKESVLFHASLFSCPAGTYSIRDLHIWRYIKSLGSSFPETCKLPKVNLSCTPFLCRPCPSYTYCSGGVSSPAGCMGAPSGSSTCSQRRSDTTMLNCKEGQSTVFVDNEVFFDRVASLNLTQSTYFASDTPFFAFGNDGPGYYFKLRYPECRKCRGGEFNPTPGGLCKQCPDFHYSTTGAGSTSCTQCPTLDGSPVPSKILNPAYPCQRCSRVGFRPHPTNGECVRCDVGEFNEDFSRTCKQKNCSAGQLPIVIQEPLVKEAVKCMTDDEINEYRSEIYRNIIGERNSLRKEQLAYLRSDFARKLPHISEDQIDEIFRGEGRCLGKVHKVVSVAMKDQV
jgi:hypothetical protein